jgi:hypothetical protein
MVLRNATDKYIKENKTKATDNEVKIYLFKKEDL